MLIKRVAYLNLLELRLSSAIRIQRKYRAYHTWSLLPKAWKMHKHNAAKMIQKYLRGYQVFTLKYSEIRRAKLR